MMQTVLARRLLPLAAVLMIGLATTPAWAQIESREGLELRDQIAELRHEVQILQAQVPGGGGGSVLGSAQRPAPSYGGGGSDITAQLLVRVDQLDEQTRQLRGRIDELQNQLQHQAEDLGKRLDDLAFQIQNPQAAAAARQAGAAGGTSPPAGAPPIATQATGVLGTLPARPPGAAPGAPRTPELAMQEGTAALMRRDYVTAEAAAHEVLNGNRTSPRAYDAMFLLAQAQYDQRQYSQAALSYDDTYNRAHKGMHAEDALLGVANALIGLNDKTSACQALVKLRVEFATPRPDLREPIAGARRRAGCR
jgi:TolA-binding protein